ncbi:MAG: arginase family protein [Bacteroidetes bacterium]|nr:arginase family protein [Bacteroidota bacterium]
MKAKPGKIFARISSINYPNKFYISFDIDGSDPKLRENTGTLVQGGFEAEQIQYLFKRSLIVDEESSPLI